MIRRLLSESISAVEQGHIRRGINPALHSLRAHEVLIKKDKSWQDVVTEDDLKARW